MKIPHILCTLGELIVGKTVIQTTINHDVHHQNPAIAARHLAMARSYIE